MLGRGCAQDAGSACGELCGPRRRIPAHLCWTPPFLAAARAHPPSAPQPIRRVLDESVAYNAALLALACFVVFAPDLATLASGGWARG